MKNAIKIMLFLTFPSYNYYTQNDRGQVEEDWILLAWQDDRRRHLREGEARHSHSNWGKSSDKNIGERKDS